jgi:hypothetical protein
MPQFGGKDSKRHFTVVMGSKEHGLYVSSTPSSAAKKAVTKLCSANKSKKVEFSIREITQGSKKKTYGPYEGYIEKLKEPIELKGRVIKYKPVAKLSGKKGAKKGRIMKGGHLEPIFSYKYKCSREFNPYNDSRIKWEELLGKQKKKLRDFCENRDTGDIFIFSDSHYFADEEGMILGSAKISFGDYDVAKEKWNYDEIIKELIKLIKGIKKIFDEYGVIPYEEFEYGVPEPKNSSNNSNNSNSPNSPNSSNRSNNSNSSNISEYSYKQFLTYLHQELEKE